MTILMTEEQVRELIREELSVLIKTDRYAFQKLLQISDGRNIQLGQTTGTKIGTATTQKLGFFNKTPIVQVTAIAAPTGGTPDAEARTAINSIRTALTNLGLTA